MDLMEEIEIKDIIKNLKAKNDNILGKTKYPLCNYVCDIYKSIALLNMNKDNDKTLLFLFKTYLLNIRLDGSYSKGLISTLQLLA